MSEEPDMEFLESKLLCIPEDDFEKFQAVSMYQEKEYIEMPLNVSPDSKATLSDVNNVASSSVNDLNSPVSSTMGSCSSLHKDRSQLDSNPFKIPSNIGYNLSHDSEMVVSNSENLNNTTVQSHMVKSDLLPRKRIKKAGETMSSSKEEQLADTSQSIQNPDISSTPFSSGPEDVETLVRKRRGRPKKVDPMEQTNLEADNSDKKQSIALGNPVNRETVQPNSKKPRGRGRKISNLTKKTLPTQVNEETHAQHSIGENQFNENMTKHVDSTNLKSSKASSKKSKKQLDSTAKRLEKIDLQGDTVKCNSDRKENDSDDQDDICLSKLKNVPDQSNNIKPSNENCCSNLLMDELKNTSSKNIDEQLHTAKKRKGRPRKTQSSAALSQHIENLDRLCVQKCNNANAGNFILKELKTKDESNIDSQDAPKQIATDPKKIEDFDNLIQVSDIEQIHDEIKVSSKQNTKTTDSTSNTGIAIISDNAENKNQTIDDTLTVEDDSKRPVRRKVKKFKYEEEPDEDPFANMELSDDEPVRGRRGNKYYSDEEYIPGKEGGTAIDSTDTEASYSNSDIKLDDTKQRKKRTHKKSENQSLRKRGKKEESNSEKIDDIEISLDTAIIKVNDGESQQNVQSSQWGNTTEFENFLAKKIQGTNLKIKKIDSNIPSASNKIEIPVIDPEAKKAIEVSTQTRAVSTTSKGVQTTSPYHTPLKENMPLTLEQSEKACQFLNSVVQTTAELGALMTQKSEDFMKKKINTKNITDAEKMDYCVKKSFLLFKLAKQNLHDMEKDLANQYDEFLKTNNLAKCIEEQKLVSPAPKETNSDSDCEIVEVLSVSPRTSNITPKTANTSKRPRTSKKDEAAFNPKTVFLNKELSIKIAKKPNENKKLDIKGRHTVWINDTVMLKKVKPMQSFLAQDSRNKKPPDNYITMKMVSDFFEGHRRRRALSICAPYVRTDWLSVSQECVCNYFTVKPVEFNMDTNHSENNDIGINCSARDILCQQNIRMIDGMPSSKKIVTSLFTMCFHIIRHHLHQNANKCEEFTQIKISEQENMKSVPESLLHLCIDIINKSIPKTLTTSTPIYNIEASHTTSQVPMPTLKLLCYRKIVELIFKYEYSRNGPYTTVLSLKSLCSKRIVKLFQLIPKPKPFNNITKITVSSLKSLCYKKVVTLLECPNDFNTHSKEHSYRDKDLYIDVINYSDKSYENGLANSQETSQKGVQSLFSLCVKFIQSTQLVFESADVSTLTPKSLQSIAFKNVKVLLFKSHIANIPQFGEESVIDGLMINCVNTLTEEAFLNLEQCDSEVPDCPEYPDDFDNENSYIPDLPCEDNLSNYQESSWISQLQIQEHSSELATVNDDVDGQQDIITRIKVEPDDIVDDCLDLIPVKSEPITGLDEMTLVPEIKPEIQDDIYIQRQNSNSYSADEFENFLSRSKLMHSLTENDTDEIYSQRSERVRMQHEPDDCDVNNPDMLNLLVPHTYETMKIKSAKGSLMQSSSDESSRNTKITHKKAVVKRKGRAKKSELKSKSNVAIPAPIISKEKEKNTNTEVAMLTRRMKEKIRQEQKQNESTDSENENITVRLRSREKKDSTEPTKDKSKTTNSKSMTSTTKPNKKSTEVSSKELDSSSNPSTANTISIDTNSEPINYNITVTDSSSKTKNIEIQCNNVDSTEQFDENLATFTGFTSIETNEMSNYEKCLKFVYERVIPENEDQSVEYKQKKEDNVVDKKAEISEQDNIPLISPDEPIELLQCEPTIPIFEDNINEKVPIKKKRKIVGPASKNKNMVSATENQLTPPTFIERHGWQCYPVDSGDAQLYKDATVYLEKLPELFVQTYFKYQNITTNTNKSDEEINRLTNLNSLNRPNILRNRKPQSKPKQVKDGKPENIPDDESYAENTAGSDQYNELVPSDEEHSRVEDEEPQPEPKQTENNLAKSLLMDDNDSEEEDVGLKEAVEVKKEGLKEAVEVKKEVTHDTRKSRKRTVTVPQESEDLMLTADKMMNKELTLLHAPVVLGNKVQETPNKDLGKRQKKSVSKSSPTNNKKKTEEDSSSEEEKQWVSTKEKLLKRMGKKESASTEDAKRAKLVSEFIERREGNLSAHKGRPARRSRRSAKNFLEREKQLRVLHRELFGEMSNDPTIGKRSVVAWKGRRNIRKVLDKKSLARSTVLANMEEFERKRRLNARQSQLRELLGCEEGVNVLVINDEVCLEYDFEQHRPVVTIHPFFTKVMKAHQYEGVKFMWDACFESLSDIEAGRPGGGCILAHCMGLGKTLQVLALLHTVLTHPRVGIRRVLVCCPLSTVLNWVDEIHKWIGPVTNQIKVFELSKLKKTYERAYQLEDWYNGGGIFIIGYELFRSLSTLDPLLDDVRPTIINKIRTALLDPGPDIVVCDEGHLLKNDCSVLAVAMSRVVTKRRIVLTGTPMQNNLREYYCMVNFVKPNLLGTYSEYSNRFENPIMNGQHRDSSVEDIKLMKGRTHILHKVLEGCLQRQEASVLYPYLPKKYEYTVFINLTQCQWELYKHYLNHYSRQLKHNSILKDFHILQKIWSHPQVLHNFQTTAQDNRNKIKLEKLEDDLATEDQEDMKDTVATDLWWLQYLDGGNMLETLESSNKFVVVFRILDECVALGDKVLIFSTSLICLNALEYFLKKIKNWSLGQDYYRLDGSVPAEVRQKWCREFNAENNLNTKLFLVSTRAGCLGLNMTAANRVIIMDTSWNPAHDIQSIFRVYRFGQKKDCFIYRLVAMGTMEQKIYERSVTKQAVACRVVDEQQIDRHYNMAELTELYRYDELGTSVAGGVAVGVRDVALLRVARDAALHAVHEHDSLLRSSERGLDEHERAAAWRQFHQEQADKQLESKVKTKIPKISLKRIQGQHYTRSVSVKEEVKIEDISDDFVPTVETKSKRGRRINKYPEISPQPGCSGMPPNVVESSVEQITPDIPGTSQEINEDESVVKKISEILIKYDFHNKKGTPDVAELLAKVKRIVKQGYINPHDTADDLTASIAKVLLPKRVTMPVLTDIMSESIDNTVSPQVVSLDLDSFVAVPGLQTEVISERERKRKATVNQVDKFTDRAPEGEPESILGTSQNDSFNTDTRKKRRAAIAAEKQFDLLSKDIIINLDEEMNPSDTDFVPDRIEKQQTNKIKSYSNENTSQIAVKNPTKDANISSRITFFDSDKEESESPTVTKPKSCTDLKLPSKSITKPGPKTYKDKIKQRYNEIVNVISDTDGRRKSTDDVEPVNNAIICDNNENDSDSSMSGTREVSVVTAQEEEVVPLPLFLLTNTNLINIVAQTYLKGNPMLDSDAATLAARYSMLKVLKEAEQTGKDVVSGAIYDIAVKVIGKPLLKKLASTNSEESVQCSSGTVEEADVTIKLMNNLQTKSEYCSNNKKITTKHKTKKTTKEKISMNSNSFNNYSIIDNDNINSSTRNTQPNEHNSKEEYKTRRKTYEKKSADSVSTRVIEIDCTIPPTSNTSGRKIKEEHTPKSGTTKQNISIQSNSVNNRVIEIDSGNVRVVNAYSNPCVVPVGMIQSAGSLPSGEVGSSESILPDGNDDMVIVLPQTSTPSQIYSQIKPVTLSAQSIFASAQSTETTRVTSTTQRNTQNPSIPPPPPPVISTPMLSKKHIIVRRGTIVFPNSAVSANSNQPEIKTHAPAIEGKPSLHPYHTICLDSDEEDTVTPVTLVRNNSAVVANAHARNDTSILPTAVNPTASPMQGNPLVVRQVSVGNNSKFVLLPAQSVPAQSTPEHQSVAPKYVSILPKTLPQETITVQAAPTKKSLQTATILSTTTPSAECLTKLKEARCKPGDIIKISGKGDIQVLQLQKKTDKPSTMNTTKSTSSVSEPTKIATPTVREPSKKKALVTESVKSGDLAHVEKRDNRISKTRTLSVSSSSSSSRAASPLDNNPLSILKNVVHIQAADDKPGTSSQNKPIARNQKPTNSTIHVKHTEDSSLLNNALAASSKESILKQVNQIMKTSQQKKCKATVQNSSGHKSTINSKVQDKANKILKDLLNKKKSKPTVNKNLITAGGSNSTVTDSSKALGKTPLNRKPFETIDLLGLGTVKAGSGASMLSTKIEIKKKASNTDATPTKTKKVAMTLKDFDIDDFDDIIELE